MPLEFEPEQTQRVVEESNVPGMANFLIKKGFAKDAAEAYKRLMILAVILIVISVAVFVFGSGPEHPPIY